MFDQSLPRKTAVYGLRNTILLSTGLLLLAMGISEFYSLNEMVGNNYQYLLRSLASTCLLIGGIIIFLPRRIIEFGDTKFFLVFPVIGMFILISFSVDSEAFFVPAFMRNALNLALPLMSIWCLMHRRNRKRLFKTLKVILSLAILGQAWEYFSWQWYESDIIASAQDLFAMSKTTAKSLLIFWGGVHIAIVGLFWSKNIKFQILANISLLILGAISIISWLVVGVLSLNFSEFILFHFMKSISILPQIILPLFFLFNEKKMRWSSRMLFDLVA